MTYSYFMYNISLISNFKGVDMKTLFFDLFYIYNLAKSNDSSLSIFDSVYDLIKKEVELENPTHLLVASGDITNSWRKGYISDYVSSCSNLSLADVISLNQVVSKLESENIKVCKQYKMESLDIIASVSSKLEGNCESIICYTNDVKALSLISNTVSVKLIESGKVKDISWINNKFGDRRNVMTYYSLFGVKSCNIKQIVKKTSTDVVFEISKYKSASELASALEGGCVVLDVDKRILPMMRVNYRALALKSELVLGLKFSEIENRISC